MGPEDQPARYSCGAQVSGGAEGTIHEAELASGALGTRTRVALKQYRRPPGTAPEWPHDGTWQQIRDQALLLRAIARNDHLVQVKEVFLGAMSDPGPGSNPYGDSQSFDTPFVVMEWIEGRSPDMLMRDQAVSLRTRLAWIGHLAEAIEVLHSTSRIGETALVHGDIKPGNCLVAETRGLVLVDTGTVQQVDGLGDHRGLRTPPYTAPEVLANPGRARDVASDLYSFGAVAFFLLTGVAPPSAERANYEADARAALLRSQELPARRRAEISDHVVALLARDAGSRITSPAGWAAQLRSLVTPPPVWTRRRRALRAAAALGVVVVVGAVLWSLPPIAIDGGTEVIADPGIEPAEESAEPVATEAAWPIRQWDQLTPYDGGTGPVVYEHDFRQPDPLWPTAEATDRTTRYEAGGYLLHPTGYGVRTPLAAPPSPSFSDEIVSATALIAGGQGAWGVWCRGNDPAGSQRYEFLLSHAGAVQIVEPGDTGSGWTYLQGLDLTKPVTIQAECADDPGRSPVRLTLSVNGRTAISYRPKTVLGPGSAGIEGMTFTDVQGQTITAGYQRFGIRRAR